MMCVQSKGQQEGQMMCVQSVANISNVPSGAESAQHTIRSIMEKSDKPCKLKCNPRNLPEPTIPKPTKKTATSESKRIIRDFFWDKFAKSEKRARERKWI